MKFKRSFGLLLMVTLLIASLAACGESGSNDSQSNGSSNNVDTNSSDTGNDTADTDAEDKDIIIDGSSTVFPITEAVTEEFRKEYPDVNVSVGVSGTGGGFKKFVLGETDISNASRPVKDSEREEAEANGIEFTEFKIAFDGLSVVVNPENTWANDMTVEELQMIWGPDSTVTNWSDVRPDWPNEAIRLYAPGTDSGTFDYFTEEINGESGAIRTDFTPSEDDNVLVQGIAGEKYALGFFGFAYYVENQDILKVVAIDGGNGPIAPSFETIKEGTYAPLSRPMFIYVNNEALEEEHIQAFVEYTLTDARALLPEVGYVEMDEAEYEAQLNKLP